MKKATFTMLFVMLTFAAFSQKYVHNITQSNARAIESQFGVLTAPVIGELGDISPNKIIDSCQWNISGVKDAATEIRPYLDEYKKYTVARYCSKNGYDLIISPMFQVRTNPEGNIMTVTVTGFPAKYKKFRPATKEDSWMLPFLNNFEGERKVKEAINQ